MDLRCCVCDGKSAWDFSLAIVCVSVCVVSTLQELREASLLIFLNKQDEPSSVTIEEITEKFALYKLFCGRSWHIQACDAVSGTGLTDGLDWLSRQLVTAIP